MGKAVKVGDIGTQHDGFPPTKIVSGSPNVTIEGQPAARVGDLLMPHAKPKHPPHPRSIKSGSKTVIINGKPAAITGGSISCGGVTIGSGTVFIGDQVSVMGASGEVSSNSESNNSDTAKDNTSWSAENYANANELICIPDHDYFSGFTTGLSEHLSKLYWIGPAATVTSAFGTGFKGYVTRLAQKAGDAILSKAKYLNVGLQMQLKNTSSLAKANSIFSNKSQTGKAIANLANSKLGKLTKGIPILGHLLAGTSIAADAYLAPEGEKQLAAQAATFSVGVGYAITGIAAVLGGLVLAPAIGVSAVVVGTISSIAAGLAYGFSGYDKSIKKAYKNFIEWW